MKKNHKHSARAVAPTREQERKLVAVWTRAGKELERIRCAELRAFDFRAQRKLVDALLDAACMHRRARTTSGLVEQQRWFKKARA
jgi:hypothetical protein